MAASNLVEPEFVAHLFAPLDGPDAAAGLAGVRTLWENCRRQLGMTQPIVEADLPGELPDDPASSPDGALAGLQDPAVGYQAIARREHDILNFSFAIAAPGAAPRARPRLAAAAPPGWYEFTRWWGNLGGGAAALGGAVVYLAKTGDVTAVDLRAEVPRQDDDADSWWEHGYPLHGFAAWETAAAGVHPNRRLVLLAGLDQDVEISRFTWSDGGTALPPIGRYLMHAAKLRYFARVLGDGRALARLRELTNGRADELAELLRDPEREGEVPERAAGLTAAEAEVVGSIRALRQMRESADIARSNMARSLPEALPGDAGLADWLIDQLGRDTALMAATREQAESIRLILGTPLPPVLRTPPPAQRAPVPPVTEAPVEHRVAFNVDVVSYSSRSTPMQEAVQQRLGGMVERVLAGLGLELNQTDRQDSGDGVIAVLPASVSSQVALPQLLHGWRAQLAADNAGHPEDRIRLRLSVGSGQFRVGATGFLGQPIIRIGRVLDSAALRGVVVEHPDADLVVGVADRLYEDVVGEGYPGLGPEEFELLHISVKSYRGQAWLWAGGVALSSSTGNRGPVPGTARDILVIHGPGPRPRKDVVELLRAMDLRPLDWEEAVKGTGKLAPRTDEVLDEGFAAGPGILVVLTPEDLNDGESHARARAVRALERQPDRTLLAQIGRLDGAGDLGRRDTVRLSADTEAARILFQYRIAQRLRNVGYPVDTVGDGWLDGGRFGGLL
ncbi:hypothetical protein BJ973_000458 [Actinoplanes tereljensis]|uniref:Uncharacterized protein n=1 Tax=Paractinoplanes tereljensis TaxID=571912 RepID=A0A919NSF4_9ACTN|nr:CATRA conflict system CASPASE/TPR repeat-associated protein [Actinoplanes tereljensis]GIF23186.1 hypothetical protein Ate02nite_59160 [Actinoplanes tereljensis]